MHQSYKTVTEFMPRSTEEDMHQGPEAIDANPQNFDALVSSAFQQFSDTDTHYRQAINALSLNPMLTSDPGALIQLQNCLSEYNNYTSLVSTVARKGVSTIETLEKSQ